MKLSQIITVDTRDGWLDGRSIIGEYGVKSLCGCRSADFFTDAQIARNRFLESDLVSDVETILCVDIHNPIPLEVRQKINALIETGDISHVIESQANRDQHRWGDRIYIKALRHATGDLVAKWDGDCIGYRRPGFDVLAYYMTYLDNGSAYVCQQTPLDKSEHKMEHASTRFFLCRRETLDLDEAERLLNDGHRASRFRGQHLPCLEHILGAMSGNRVMYPPSQDQDFIVWSWVHYFKGIIATLNGLPYEDVLRYVEACGGVHGASDLIGVPL